MLGTINKLGVLGTVVATGVNLGCCAAPVFGSLTGVLFAGGVLYRVPVAWSLPLLYGSLVVALIGFGQTWRRHRRVYPMLLFLPGAAAVLYPVHVALEVSVLKVLIWLGFGLLLAAAAWDVWLVVRTRTCGRTVSRSEVYQ